MKKIFFLTTIFKQFLYVGLILAILLGGGISLIYTNAGLRFLTGSIAHIIPGKLKVEKISGSLSDKVVCENINYVNKTLQLSVGRLEFTLQPKALLKSTVHFSSLQASNIEIHYAIGNNYFAKGAAKNTFTLKTWLTLPALHPPFNLQVDDCALKSITWYQSKLNHANPISIDKITCATTEHDQIKHWKFKVNAKTAVIDIDDTANIWLWNLKIPSLQELIPTFRGSIESTGNIAIFKNSLLLKNFTIDAANLKMGDLAIKQLKEKITQDPLRINTALILLHAKELNTPQISIPQILITGEFRPLDANTSTLILNTKDVNYSFFKASKTSFPILRNLSAKLKFTKHGLESQTILEFAKVSPIYLTLNFPGFTLPTLPSKSQVIYGEISWQANNLAAMQPFFSNFSALQDINGKLQLQTKITGSLAEPQIKGQFTLSDGSASIPKLGIKLHNVNLSIQKTANKNLLYQASLSSQQGALHLQGETSMLNNPLFLKGKISGDNFLAINTKEYKVLLSPQLTFQATPKLLDLSGDVYIDEATIAPQTFKGTTSLPPETTFAHQQNFLNKIDALPLKSRIKLILGNSVNINVMGIKGALTGKILIIDEPQKPTTAEGKFTLTHGSYDLYGQTLKIHEGEMIFNGGILTNPQLNIKASRRIKNAAVLPMTSKGIANFNTFSISGTEPRILDLTVGLNIKGYIDNLKTTLFSEPAGVLSPTDILSFLVLGQSTADSSGDKTQLLLKAATALNFGGTGNEFTKITNQLQKQLGLSELTVGAENMVTTTTKDGIPTSEVTTNTALMLGKYLSPKLYIGYSIGLIEPINIFRIRYRLNHHWSVQSESSSSGNGADVLYTVERE